LYPRNTSSRSIYREAGRAATLGLAINLMLGVVKLIGGFVGHSFALLSDSVNSLGDSLSGILVLVALRIAQKPGDAEHPYGHTRAEAIAASSVALLIIITALYIGWQAILRISQPDMTPSAWTLWIAGANVVIKEALYQYNVRVGRRTGSGAIIANAWDHRSDALCSMAVLVGLGIVRVAGPTYAWADEAAALIVVVAILWSGLVLYRASASELMDPQADDEFVAAIRAAAKDVPGIIDVEKLRVRKTGLEYLVDMHIEVDASISVLQGHQLGHLVKDQLLTRFLNIRDVLIHLEPHPNPAKNAQRDRADA